MPCENRNYGFDNLLIFLAISYVISINRWYVA